MRPASLVPSDLWLATRPPPEKFRAGPDVPPEARWKARREIDPSICGRPGPPESMYVEPAYALRLLEEHPERVGYLLKERVFDVAILVDALLRLTDGETVIDPTIVSRLLGRRRVRDPLEQLTAREREVLALVAEGLSNRALAERLVVTERTVEAHVTQIFLKLGLGTDSATHRRVLAVLAYLRSEQP